MTAVHSTMHARLALTTLALASLLTCNAQAQTAPAGAGMAALRDAAQKA